MARGDASGPGSSEEHFCLRWNDFQESILHTLQDLREEEDFVDVTLVCEDGEPIMAHQLILSACSDVFRNILKRSGGGGGGARNGSSPSRLHPAMGQNPVILLWDVSAQDMRHILRFMYNGEVEVRHSHLNTFLSVAERLRVRGLCNSGGKTSPAPTQPSQPTASTSHAETSASRRSSSPQPPPPPPTAGTPPPGPSSATPHASASTSRRSSLGGDHTPTKRPRLSEDVPIKEEAASHLGGRDGSPTPGPSSAADFGNGGGGGGSQPDDKSQLGRSGASSEAEEYTDYWPGGAAGAGEGGYDDHPGSGPLPMPASLMGMSMGGMSPRGMLDPNAAKEFWRRAALSHMMGHNSSAAGTGSPFHQRSSSQDGPHGMNPGGGGGGGGATPPEPTRRQRSVYTQQQIAQLEAYFQFNEYIDGDRKKQLSRLTNIPEHQIKVWFQNRRQKKKREQEEQQQQHMQRGQQLMHRDQQQHQQQHQHPHQQQTHVSSSPSPPLPPSHSSSSSASLHPSAPPSHHQEREHHNSSESSSDHNQ